MVQLHMSLQQRRQRHPALAHMSIDCAALKAAPRHEVGDRWLVSDRYDFLKRIGEGSISTVDMAIRRSDGKSVAMKMTRTSEPELLKMAREECELLQSLDHPNIIKAYEFHSTSYCACMVMEIFDGMRLSSAVRRQANKRFSENTSRLLFRQILDAVDYLHEHRIVHRDIKPQNMLVAHQLDKIVLLDFNVARNLAKGGCYTMTGTYLYAAPEVLLGQSPFEGSDVWAAGLCLHIMLTGRLPQGRDQYIYKEHAVTEVANKELTFEDKLWNDVSMPCKETLQQCLAVNALWRPSAMILLMAEWFSASACGGSTQPQEQLHPRPQTNWRRPLRSCSSRSARSQGRSTSTRRARSR
mmetsp:Transcript_17947/g.38242  ORF Transcript_17947/g.38242 Transcript_17947/m.38242 type:complete len:354 (+) Transcript_17947:44-1105(+)